MTLEAFTHEGYMRPRYLLVLLFGLENEAIRARSAPKHFPKIGCRGDLSGTFDAPEADVGRLDLDVRSRRSERGQDRLGFFSGP
ncbi:hypothetical protein XI00_03940 [Bradyrhizobium sp. CCBAU 21359]|nr:hypothetical protein [Bradyrhizobium sp. CCBAU 21359]